MPKTTHRFDATRIALYCRTRLAAHLAPDDLLRLRAYLELCLAKGQFPPYRGHAVDAVLLSEQTGIETTALRSARPHIQPLCDALCRALADQPPSYAIQDTPEMVAQHYGRFLPQDKAEIAARVLNQVWQAV